MSMFPGQSSTSVIPPGMSACSWCGPGVFHGGMCPRVKAISYHPGGGIAHVEFHATTDDREEGA